MLSDLDRAEYCITQIGKCVTNNNIILWNMKYQRIVHTKGLVYMMHGSHIIKSELQTSLIFNNYKQSNFTKPYRMDGDIIMDMGPNSSKLRNRRIKNFLPAIKLDKLLLMETNKGDKFDSENTKFQYLFDNLQQNFQRQISIVHQRSCQNRNNLLLLIESDYYYKGIM
ncbi:unnamed protein product [Dracunculus medinensis]|uniref:Tub domain-containing protein n=1 Tax=Dracunculus medinensis TaxID=318479 RepID=A0A0N4UHE7_DRAME|nr:unnamed protein product [Dracunculus medinensis]